MLGNLVAQTADSRRAELDVLCPAIRQPKINQRPEVADDRAAATHRSKVAKIARWSLWVTQSGSGSAQQPVSRSRSDGVASK